MTVKVSFLILLLSISLSTQAGERLQNISDSMAKSANLFSKLFDDELENEDVDSTGKRQAEEITVETKQEAERDAVQIKEGEQHGDIKDDSASFFPDQEKKSVDSLPEIDILSDINDQFEDTINQLQAATEKPTTKTPLKRPTQLFVGDRVTNQTTNEHQTSQAADKDCVKEKVYSLDVDNAAQYERLEDFPFTYECVIQR